MPPSLDHVFTLRGFFSEEYMLDVQTVKGGSQRLILPITRGYLRGSGLDAELIPGGGDWLLLNPETPVGHLDVRLNLRTSDGHSMYIRYEGLLKVDETSASQLSASKDAKTTQYGDHEWYITPIMETSDADFKWIESSVFLGEGRWVVEEGALGVEYEIYRLQPNK